MPEQSRNQSFITSKYTCPIISKRPLCSSPTCWRYLLRRYFQSTWNTNAQTETQAQCQMVLVGLGSNGPTLIDLPLPRPHLAVWNDISGRTTTVYNILEQSLPSSLQREWLIHLTIINVVYGRSRSIFSILGTGRAHQGQCPSADVTVLERLYQMESNYHLALLA